MKRPIRVFWSPLTERFYASQHYKVTNVDGGSEQVEITGPKFDVTQDVARIIVGHGVEFTASANPSKVTR